MKAYKISLSLLILLLLNSTAYSQYKNWFKFTLSSGTYKDESIIRFCQSATDTFDYDWDAYKLKNGGITPNLYTKIENTSYSINSLPDSFLDRNVTLHLDVAFAGVYTISFIELKATDSLCTVTLIDNFLNTSTDLKVNSSYTFNCEVGLYAERFVVNFKKKSPTDSIVDDSDNSNAVLPDSIDKENMDSPLKVTYIGDRIIIEMKEIVNEVTIVLTDLSGKEIRSTTMVPLSELVEFEVRTIGFHVIKIVAGNHQHFGKIYVESL